MNNTQEIYQWFKEHEDNTLMCYEIFNKYRSRHQINGFTIEVIEDMLKLNIKDGGYITFPTNDLHIITDKNKMNYSDRLNHNFKVKVDSDDKEYDMQLVNDNSLMSFVIIK